MLILGASSPSAFWFLTRGTGAVTLVLLTVTVALGVLNVRRTQLDGVPRFVIDGVHRTASLLAVSFLVVHIATALLDGFAPITLLDVVIPFRAAYRPLWVGFGAVAFDLMVAVLITSLMRRRLGYASWRATHWLAYASWPVALLHGLGTGSDTRTHWMLVLSGVCVVAMLAAILARVASGWPARLELRIPALIAVAAVPLGLIAWLPGGPLAPGWARRAGTPTTLLAAAHTSGGTDTAPAQTAPPAPVAVGTGSPAPASEGDEQEHSFSTLLRGTVRQSAVGGGQELVDISLTASGQPLNRLHIQIRGQALPGGGVSLGSSQVTLGPGSDPGQYSGQVTGLNGTELAAHVAYPGYAAYTLLARLHLPPGTGAASGTMTASAQEGEH